MVVKVFQSAACIMQNEQSPHSFSKLRKAKHNQSEGVICLFKHEKQLFHPVEVEQPNPQYAALLQEQLGGGNGELKAAMQYMSQSFRIRNPKIKDLFMDIAAEELSHMEMVAQTINLLNGHDVEADKVQAGEIETHVLLGLNPGLINASGYSWTADYVTVTGDLCADLLSNIASEQRAKVVYEYLYRQIEDKRYGKPSTSCSTVRRRTTKCSGMPLMRCRTAAPIRTSVRLRRQRCISPCPTPAPMHSREMKYPGPSLQNKSGRGRVVKSSSAL